MTDAEKIAKIIEILNEYPAHTFKDEYDFWIRYSAKKRILNVLEVKDFRDPGEFKDL